MGIGRAVALALGEAGAAVGVHYHTSQGDAETTLRTLQERGGKGVLLPADLSKEDEATAVVDRLVAQAGRLDILVNNAGSPLRFTKIEDCPTDLWRQVFEVNVTSAFFVTRARSRISRQRSRQHHQQSVAVGTDRRSRRRRSLRGGQGCPAGDDAPPWPASWPRKCASTASCPA